MDIDEFQRVIADTYGAKDAERGTAPTIAWLCEEVGELAQATRKGTRAQQVHELGDVIAWVVSLAHQLGIPMSEAIGRYVVGCPVCAATPCVCVQPSVRS